MHDIQFNVIYTNIANKKQRTDTRTGGCEKNEVRSGSGVRAFRPYSTGRLLRHGFRLKSEVRDRSLARTGPHSRLHFSHTCRWNF